MNPPLDTGWVAWLSAPPALEECGILDSGIMLMKPPVVPLAPCANNGLDMDSSNKHSVNRDIIVTPEELDIYIACEPEPSELPKCFLCFWIIILFAAQV